MTEREAIEALKTYPTDLSAVPAQAVTEMNFRRALPMATEALEKQEKYRWHDLRKVPCDLPSELYQVLTKVIDSYNPNIKYDCGWICHGEWMHTNGEVIAWRCLEPFEEGDTDGK